MIVRNFSGGEVNAICHCAVSLMWKLHKCDASVRDIIKDINWDKCVNKIGILYAYPRGEGRGQRPFGKWRLAATDRGKDSSQSQY